MKLRGYLRREGQLDLIRTQLSSNQHRLNCMHTLQLLLAQLPISI